VTNATGAVATIIRCSDLVRHVYSTLVSVEQQTLGRGEIVLVSDESTPAAARQWLAAVAQERGMVLVHAASIRPGAAKNAGIRAAMAQYIVCVDAGDLLAPHCHEICAAALVDDPRIGVVSSWVRVVGAPQAPVDAPAGKFGAEGLVGDPGAVHPSSMFRRHDWDSLGGFDENLSALEYYEFWLRLAGAGYEFIKTAQPLLIRAWRKDSLWYRDQAEESYLQAMSSICRTHESLLRRHIVHLLHARERRLVEIGEEYHRLVSMRDSGVTERERLVQRSNEFRGMLPEDRRGAIDLGDLRRTTPVDRNWGYSRGVPIDRHYIERFLESCAADICGSVLEVQESDYTRRFGEDRVTHSDVVDLNPDNPLSTILSDLRAAANIPSERYDCVILTQTLHVIREMPAVLAECWRILKPGGVLLATFPCASRLCLEYGPNDDFWRVTAAGARALVEPIFGGERLDVRSFGNVLANAAFLYGLGCHELTADELDAEDPFFPLLVGIRAQKPGSRATGASGDESGPPRRNGGRRKVLGTGSRGAVLLYHRVANTSSDVHELAVPPEGFRLQMMHLRQLCHPMPLEALVTSAREGRLPPKSVAVTFDDGYLDNQLIAAPILRAFSIPATFFISTYGITRPPEFWWDTLARSLLDASVQRPAQLSLNLPQGTATFPTETAADCLAAHWAIYNGVVGRPAAVRDEVVESVRQWSGVPVGASSAHCRMDTNAIRALATVEGCTIGAHTVHHEVLPQRPPEDQRREVVDCRLTLERLLGRRVATFAYPFGAWDAATIDVVRDASFDVAVTCDESPVTSDVDPWRVPRVAVTLARTVDFPGWLDSVIR
jgi:peptidoglycan/xylan/chitin deacetylase (PgdA/CDA1 family)